MPPNPRNCYLNNSFRQEKKKANDESIIGRSELKHQKNELESRNLIIKIVNYFAEHLKCEGGAHKTKKERNIDPLERLALNNH